MAKGVFLAAIDPERVVDAVVYIASPRANQLSGIVFNLGWDRFRERLADWSMPSMSSRTPR